MGLQDDPVFQDMAAKLHESTEILEKMWQEQSDPSYQRKWWQDGEYDSDGADQ